MRLDVILELTVLGLLEGSMYSLMAVGLTLIFGVMRVLNVSHGDLGILGAYMCYWLLALYGVDPFISLALMIPLLFLIGFCTQKFIINPAISDPRFQVTASVMICYGLALFVSNQEIIIWGPDYRAFTVPYSYLSFSILGLTINVPRIAVLLITVAISALYVLLLRTKLGKAIRACVQDREAAMLMGINFNSLAGVTFGMSVATAGVAGMLYALIHSLYPALGFHLTIRALTVMVFGGIGSVGGALAGGILLGIGECTVSYFIGSVYKDLVGFFILVAVLLLKPTGLFGKAFFLPR